MIDYLSLALGHGLLALALFRLVMRDDLDIDPEIQALAEKAEEERAAKSIIGRNARRRAEPDAQSAQATSERTD